jgi:hypothetical protein
MACARYLGWHQCPHGALAAKAKSEYQYHIRHNLPLRLHRQVAGKSAGGTFRPGLLSAFEEGSKFWCLSVAVETGRVRLGAWLQSGKVRAQTQ